MRQFFRQLGAKCDLGYTKITQKQRKKNRRNMKIGLTSDTHDNYPNIKKAIEIFKKKGVTMVLHAGDLVAPVNVPLFRDFDFKLAKGNCDGDVEALMEKIDNIDGEFYDDIGFFDVHSKKFALYHGKNEIQLQSLIDSQDFDYIITGHTHKKRDDKIGRTRVINPGGHYPDPAEKPHTIAILDLEKDVVEFVEIR
ncbi:YfcE family phosphodiesterase [Candidatus Woesearchaeota archaeon]|nr:YfcE family phosphodiesterase [Candidatus Woesearchaeota archaeon]